LTPNACCTSDWAGCGHSWDVAIEVNPRLAVGASPNKARRAALSDPQTPPRQHLGSVRRCGSPRSGWRTLGSSVERTAQACGRRPITAWFARRWSSALDDPLRRVAAVSLLQQPQPRSSAAMPVIQLTTDQHPSRVLASEPLELKSTELFILTSRPGRLPQAPHVGCGRHIGDETHCPTDGGRRE